MLFPPCLIAFLLITLKTIVDVEAKITIKQQQKHPLSPLDAQEISATSDFIIQQHPAIKPLFISITLLEPPKAILAPYLAQEDLSTTSNGNAIKKHNIPRKTFTILVNEHTGLTCEVVVNLSSNPTSMKVESFVKLKNGTQPQLSNYEDHLVGAIVKNDSAVVGRLNKLGIVNTSLLQTRAWIHHFNDNPKLKQNRIVQVFLYFHEVKNDNDFAHPLNFLPIVDLIQQKVLFIQELPLYSNFTILSPDGKIKLPYKESNYNPTLLINSTTKGNNKINKGGFFRTNVKPVNVSLPQGTSFVVSKDGYGIEWQKFKMRLSFNSREGLVLHQVSYKDGSVRRPLLYRASISEMIVPYGDPRPPFHNKRALDFGDYGIGYNANPLKLGLDCWSDGYLIDIYLSDEKGEPILYPNVICVQEIDDGILHKHTENGKVSGVRAVQLSIHFMATLGNYDYGLYWKFGQDASIHFEAQLTGLVSTNLVAEGVKDVPYGTIVSPQVYAQNHQHLFSARLDTMFDGENNSVSIIDIHPIVETNVMSSPPQFPPNDPYGQGFVTNETLLRTENEATTDMCLETDRIWVISNPSSINEITSKPVSWKLIPINKRLLLAKQGSINWKVGTFGSHAVWVTKYHEDEDFAAGKYVNQLTGEPQDEEDKYGGEGLPKYVRNNEKIVNEDVVLWHTFGTTHIVRIEDYPIMAVEKTGFTLKPRNFFNSYPGLDWMYQHHQPMYK